MGLLFKQLFGLIKLLNSETGTYQISAGLALGLALGMSPMLSLQGLILFFLMITLRVQMGAAFISAFFFSFVAYLLDPLSHLLGAYILHQQWLVPLWTKLYNMPIVPFTRFNNTVVMGSGVLGFILIIPSFFFFLKMVEKYRDTVYAKWKNSKLFKVLKSTALYQWYYKYQSFYG